MRSRVIEWQVAGACNYDCSYCIQSKKYRRGTPAADAIERYLDFFARLPEAWEIKCSGGEAFAHPLFLGAIVPGLMKRTPHWLSILTNFSSSRADLERFLELAGPRLRVFSASLHLEFTGLEEFADKAAWFVARLPPTVRFVVNQVVLPHRLEESASGKKAIEERGLQWFPQLYKTKTGLADYPDKTALRRLLGPHPGPAEANLAPSYRGRTCWTGVDYFILDKDGEAWSCRTAKRFGDGHLGNVLHGGVQLRSGPEPCPYEICPCTVPANRGMIEGLQPANREEEQ